LIRLFFLPLGGSHTNTHSQAGEHAHAGNKNKRTSFGFFVEDFGLKQSVHIEAAKSKSRNTKYRHTRTLT